MTWCKGAAVAAAIAGLLLSVEAGAHGPEPHAGQSATGIPGKAGAAARVVYIEMAEPMQFVPDHIVVRRGETIRFVFRNTDYREHEFVIGEIGALKAHAEHMRLHPGMVHTEPNSVSVPPYNEGELLWLFTTPGRVDFACLIPGHFEAGMHGTVTVK